MCWRTAHGCTSLKWPARREQLGLTTERQRGESWREPLGSLSQPGAAGLRFSTSTGGQLPAWLPPAQAACSQTGSRGCHFKVALHPPPPGTWDCASQGCHNRAAPHQSLSPTSHTSASKDDSNGVNSSHRRKKTFKLPGPSAASRHNPVSASCSCSTGLVPVPPPPRLRSRAGHPRTGRPLPGDC